MRTKANKADSDLISNPSKLKKYLGDRGVQYKSGGRIRKAPHGDILPNLVTAPQPFTPQPVPMIPGTNQYGDVSIQGYRESKQERQPLNFMGQIHPDMLNRQPGLQVNTDMQPINQSNNQTNSQTEQHEKDPRKGGFNLSNALAMGLSAVDMMITNQKPNYPGFQIPYSDTSHAYGDGTQAIAKSGIHIKPENKGKFTAYKKRTGKTTAEALKSKDPKVRKMANFARNAAKWKKEDGGELPTYYEEGKEYDLSNEQVKSLLEQGYELDL